MISLLLKIALDLYATRKTHKVKDSREQSIIEVQAKSNYVLELTAVYAAQEKIRAIKKLDTSQAKKSSQATVEVKEKNNIDSINPNDATHASSINLAQKEIYRIYREIINHKSKILDLFKRKKNKSDESKKLPQDVRHTKKELKVMLAKEMIKLNTLLGKLINVFGERINPLEIDETHKIRLKRGRDSLELGYNVRAWAQNKKHRLIKVLSLISALEELKKDLAAQKVELSERLTQDQRDSSINETQRKAIVLLEAQKTASIPDEDKIQRASTQKRLTAAIESSTYRCKDLINDIQTLEEAKLTIQSLIDSLSENPKRFNSNLYATAKILLTSLSAAKGIIEVSPIIQEMTEKLEAHTERVKEQLKEIKESETLKTALEENLRSLNKILISCYDGNVENYRLKLNEFNVIIEKLEILYTRVEKLVPVKGDREKKYSSESLERKIPFPGVEETDYSSPKMTLDIPPGSGSDESPLTTTPTPQESENKSSNRRRKSFSFFPTLASFPEPDEVKVTRTESDVSDLQGPPPLEIALVTERTGDTNSCQTRVR